MSDLTGTFSGSVGRLAAHAQELIGVHKNPDAADLQKKISASIPELYDSSRTIAGQPVKYGHLTVTLTNNASLEKVTMSVDVNAKGDIAGFPVVAPVDKKTLQTFDENKSYVSSREIVGQSHTAEVTMSMNISPLRPTK